MASRLLIWLTTVLGTACAASAVKPKVPLKPVSYELAFLESLHAMGLTREIRIGKWRTKTPLCPELAIELTLHGDTATLDDFQHLSTRFSDQHQIALEPWLLHALRPLLPIDERPACIIVRALDGCFVRLLERDSEVEIALGPVRECQDYTMSIPRELILPSADPSSSSGTTSTTVAVKTTESTSEALDKIVAYFITWNSDTTSVEVVRGTGPTANFTIRATGGLLVSATSADERLSLDVAINDLAGNRVILLNAAPYYLAQCGYWHSGLHADQAKLNAWLTAILEDLEELLR